MSLKHYVDYVSHLFVGINLFLSHSIYLDGLCAAGRSFLL